MTPAQLQILQHTLGMDEYGRSKEGKRNHFCGEDATCRALVALGYMKEASGFPSALSGGDPVFTATPAGRAAVAAESPKPPRLTRGQRRYQAWLGMDWGWTFGEFLKSGLAKEV